MLGTLRGRDERSIPTVDLDAAELTLGVSCRTKDGSPRWSYLYLYDSTHDAGTSSSQLEQDDDRSPSSVLIPIHIPLHHNKWRRTMASSFVSNNRPDHLGLVSVSGAERRTAVISGVLVG